MHVASETGQTAILWPILGGILIILANAFFVTVEFAIVTARRGPLERMADKGNASAKLVVRLLQDPDWAIAGSQLGITVASILLGIVAEEPLKHLLEPGLTRLFSQAPFLDGLATALATLIVLLILTFLHMVLGEQVPKTIALRFPQNSALFIARPMSLFARLTSPLVWVVDHSTALVLRILGVGGQTGGHGIHTVEELEEVVRETRQGGVIPIGDERMLLRAMAFSGRFVREAMIPRPDIVAFEKTTTLRELLYTFKDSRHSRFPVYEEDLDHICGVIAMKEVVSFLIENPDAGERTLEEMGVIHPVLVVPESRHIGNLFNQMRRDRTHMAIVIDEFGGTAGIVTSEELAEEVVGRLTDEWVTEMPFMASLGSGAYEIDAQSRVNEVNEALKLELPTSTEYETLAGFLLSLIRRIPRVGDVIGYENARFTILQMSGPKIERVRIEQV